MNGISKFGGRLSGPGAYLRLFSIRGNRMSFHLCVMTAEDPPNFLVVSIEFTVGVKRFVIGMYAFV